MKKYLTTSLLLAFALLATSHLQAKDLLYYVDICNFYDNTGTPYSEVYLDIDAGSVAYDQAPNGGLQAVIEVHYFITNKENNAGDAVAYDKTFDLLSPIVTDTSNDQIRFGIMDIRRISLPPGNYQFKGYLKDKISKNPHLHQFVFDVNIKQQPTSIVSFSDIEFVQSVKPSVMQRPHSKLGYDIMPLVTNGTYQDMDSLHFYLETYNTQLESEGTYFVQAFISLSSSTSKIENLSRTLRQSSKPIDIVYSSFSIKDLPTQTYYLNIVLYNKNQDVIASTMKKFFVVNTRMEIEGSMSANAFDEVFKLTDEQLNYYLHTLYYISTNTERSFNDALSTIAEKKNFFFNFWENRKGNSNNPVKAWTEYRARVDYANQQFKAAHLEGWRTDRGRVILTYGVPNDVERHPSDNSKHPYEIWRYNKIKTQSGVRFIFYNPNEATADLNLIHSDLRGEVNNPRWEFVLYRNASDANLDKDNLEDRWK